MEKMLTMAALAIFVGAANAALVFEDDFSTYTAGTSIAGSNWDPKNDTGSNQQGLMTGSGNVGGQYYAILDGLAESDYHVPCKTAFNVGSTNTATIRSDFRYSHLSGGNITALRNTPAFGLLLSTTPNWNSGTNKGAPFTNRDNAIGMKLPVSPWQEGWITHSSMGVNTTTGGVSDWFAIEMTLSPSNGTLWAKTDLLSNTGSVLVDGTEWNTGWADNTTLYAGYSTTWNTTGANLETYAKFDEVHVDNFSIQVGTDNPPVTNPPPPTVTNGPLHILIDPEVSVAIDGHLELNREQFICLSDAGKKVESKVSNASQVDYYINDLGMTFGRELGGAYGVVGWNQAAVVEDTARPGYVNMANLANKLNPDNGGSSAGYMSHFSPNLNVATHDRYPNVPAFMPTWVASGDSATHTHAVNADAYGEFVAGVLEYGYTDWTRPATYEIVNEPDWRVWGDQRFADIHTAVKTHVDAAGLNVAIGGPCMSVGYFYKNNYGSFNLKGFIDNTGCNLDFYSFHNYDYMHWDAAVTDFNGRVSSGLPIDGVLDLVQSYTHNAYGKGVDIVLSEHGGYISTDQEGALDTIANTYFPGSGFAFEMKRRSVSEQLAVSSAIANTMTFMNHPHVVRKAVPFILLESASWNPSYYSTLLVKENFDPNSSVWYESTYVNFFKFFQNVSGRHIRTMMNDPDLQCHAYANGNKLYILLNNLARQAEELALDIPTANLSNIIVRRVGRNADFTPYFTSTLTNSLDGLQIERREAMALEIEYTQPFAEKLVLNEVPYYSSLYQQQFTGSKTFNVAVTNLSTARSAMLRIGVGRGTGTDQDLQVVFNGTALNVPMEDCADYLENENEYGSTKLIPVPLSLLQASNSIQVTFPNNGTGGIGAVVLRVGHEQSSAGPVYSEWAQNEGLAGTNALRSLDLDGDSFDNTAEFIAGTDPQNGGSFLTTLGAPETGGYRISVDSKLQRLYGVEITENLLSGWTQLTNGIPGTGNFIDIIDQTGSTNRFYRITVEVE